VCTAVREPSGSDRPPHVSPVSACGVPSGMRQVTAFWGSAARGSPLPASATAQRLRACTRRRWLTGSRGYAVHGLGADSRRASRRSRDIRRISTQPSSSRRFPCAARSLGSFAGSRTASWACSGPAMPSTTEKWRTNRPHGVRNPSPTSHERPVTMTTPSGRDVRLPRSPSVVMAGRHGDARSCLPADPERRDRARFTILWPDEQPGVCVT
jgi:hypothetical protein